LFRRRLFYFRALPMASENPVELAGLAQFVEIRVEGRLEVAALARGDSISGLVDSHRDLETAELRTHGLTHRGARLEEGVIGLALGNRGVALEHEFRELDLRVQI